ncbi:nuclear transport factor 2 family protein [Saccharopolyspora phatthalungensis]|uniref:Ketosteroid isomerase-like protein n=1 Tax=Saccharopolyspora phatthalungensis TaxID=664693 RepID=A0A840QK53_9PSEU|nr:nuclear transport factor 2 family protein [Saccharopolyspora phatthalungensis]MBB5159938.1 ketosteroid isomerase-like protein [Saccharopolyspora phatthalungensis]
MSHPLDPALSKTDREQISARLHRFTTALDEKDFHAYADCYTEDGILELPWGQHEGREGLAEAVSANLAKFPRTQHTTRDHVITQDGDRGTLRAQLHSVHWRSEADTDPWIVEGIYDCRLTRTASGWKFSNVALSVVSQQGGHDELEAL